MITLQGIQILVFGGTCSNLQAAETIFSEADRLGIARENCICTGDMIGYFANPKETLDLIRANGGPIIQGNVENSLGNDAETCGCNFNEGSVCDTLAKDWYQFAKEALTDEDKAYLRSLPETLEIEWQGLKLAVVHGGFTQQNRYLFPSTPDAVFAEELKHTDADVVLAGHSGLPFTRGLDHQLWHNTGSAGLPANDGTPYAWYSVLTCDHFGLRLQHKKLIYPYKEAVSAMAATSLPQDYAKSLETGLWPSTDILPETETERTGQPLPEDELFLPFEGEE